MILFRSRNFKLLSIHFNLKAIKTKLHIPMSTMLIPTVDDIAAESVALTTFFSALLKILSSSKEKAEIERPSKQHQT